MTTDNSNITDLTVDVPSNHLLPGIPALMDDEENTESESDEVVPTQIHRMLTTAFRLAGQRRTFIDFDQVRQQLPGAITKTWGEVLIEEIRGEIRELRTKPAFLRCLGFYVTKEELESKYPKIESLTRIFEEMSLFCVFFQKRRDKPTAAGA